MTPTHECPGGCGAQVDQRQLACKPCWFRLPRPLRDAVSAAWRHRIRNPRPHREAIRAAVRWYGNNPASGEPMPPAVRYNAV